MSPHHLTAQVESCKTLVNMLENLLLSALLTPYHSILITRHPVVLDLLLCIVFLKKYRYYLDFCHQVKFISIVSRENKLALLGNNDLLSSTKTINEYYVFTKVTCVPLSEHKIVHIGTGPNHCAMVTGKLVLKLNSGHHVSI